MCVDLSVGGVGESRKTSHYVRGTGTSVLLKSTYLKLIECAEFLYNNNKCVIYRAHNHTHEGTYALSA